jgi:8-oxo-dGTP pyrophosphatase MutT (NUDIX family)
LKSKVVYSNPWIRVREDKVITPHGDAGIYGVVEAKPAIGIVALTKDLKTYLVGQYRYTLNTYSWEIPEGGAEDNENLLEAAKRELLEETGLSANKWTELGEPYTSNCFTNERAYIFIAEDLSKGEARPDPTELLELKKLPFMETWQMVLDQEIKDSLAVTALMRTYHLLQQQGKL